MMTDQMVDKLSRALPCRDEKTCGQGDNPTCDNCQRIINQIERDARKDEPVTITPLPIDVQFRNLTAVSTTLGQSTDALAEIIKGIEEKLKRLGLGLICWLTIDKHPNKSSLHIGYGQIDNKHWCLMARLGDDVWALNYAPRWIRIKAVNHFPELLDHITKAALAMIERTEKATTTAREFLAAIQAGDSHVDSPDHSTH